MNSVALLIGSLRRDSINRKLAHAIIDLAKDRLFFTEIDLDELPMYNEDLWSVPQPAVQLLKRDVEAADAVLFVTPEYNRSFSPTIKNAIDWGTRPWGQNSWSGKPAAIIGASPGALGTAAAQNALRNLVSVCDMALMGQPEIYFQYKPELFDEKGRFLDGVTRDFVSNWIDRFAAWIERTGPAKKAG